MQSIIAIDLGSNSLRILKFACETKETLGEFHKTVKTADGLGQTGKINDEAIKRVILAIKEAQEKLDFSNAHIKAVTTEAIRQAKNGLEVLIQIKNETGVPFEVIDGEAEAKYALRAVENRLEILGQKPKSFLLVDIGGGSTEMLFYYGKEQYYSESFKVGIVTVTQKYNDLGDIAKAIPEVMMPMREYYHKMLKEHGALELFIATAGTPTTIAAMKLGMDYETYDSKRIHGTTLSQEDLSQRLEELLAMNKEERIKAVGVGRDDLIASGVLIYNELYNISGFKESMVIDDGVREGIAFDECLKE